ncbi:MAG: hypothetical protein IPI67_00090 [Myxococcales bacterium]|nr:hypothetical protein [Myxococcales bacterium]
MLPVWNAWNDSHKITVQQALPVKEAQQLAEMRHGREHGRPHGYGGGQVPHERQHVRAAERPKSATRVSRTKPPQRTPCMKDQLIDRRWLQTTHVPEVDLVGTDDRSISSAAGQTSLDYVTAELPLPKSSQVAKHVAERSAHD